jgi:CheY-like chemotaxis protein
MVATNAPHTPCHVLLADDDPLLREIAGEYLREVGFKVTTATDGQEALDEVATWRFDLIITDMVMPNLDGIELIKALKHAAPGTPVMAISAGIAGSNADLILRAAMAVGAVSVLAKPLERASFLREVAAAITASDRPSRAGRI